MFTSRNNFEVKTTVKSVLSLRVRSNKLHIVHGYAVLFIFQESIYSLRMYATDCIRVWTGNKVTWPQSKSICQKKACKNDPQCGEGMCCAVSIWVKSIRICTPMGKVGDSCHPMSHKVPYMGERKHHTCPCLPDLACSRNSSKRYTCSARK
nr:prokineticin-2 isoform X5 [Odocoileus virginianus texanus]